MRERMHFLAVTLCFISSWSSQSEACTRLLHSDKNQAVMVGRNMDWMEDMRTDLMVQPRGRADDGHVDANPVRWTSKFGSIVATAYDLIPTDGMNEAGLSAQILWLGATEYAERCKLVEGLSVSKWLPFYLDNFATVAEAVAYTQSHPMQLVEDCHTLKGRCVNLHLAISDAKGDSAIFESVAGHLKIYHSSDYGVLTNDPPYDQQLVNRKKYSGFGGDQTLPGTSDPRDRFVRASYLTERLPPSTSAADQLAGVLSVLGNTAQVYAIPDGKRPFVAKTIWRSVADMTNKVYYFQATDTQNLLRVSLDHFDLSAGAPVMRLHLPSHPDYVGKVEDKFVKR